MRKHWEIHLTPGTHFDYGWAASPGECFSYLTEDLRTAIGHHTIEPILVRTALDCGTVFYYYDQNQTFTFDHALYPHRRHWKPAVAHRAGWEFNSPLYACNWTPCFPIKPLRLSRNLPERDSFFRVDKSNVVVTAIAPSAEDPHAFIVRMVEFHGEPARVTLKCRHGIAEAREVNFLERDLGNVAVDGNLLTFKVRPHGIHTIKLRLIPQMS
jgi:alpha-mannosidase